MKSSQANLNTTHYLVEGYVLQQNWPPIQVIKNCTDLHIITLKLSKVLIFCFEKDFGCLQKIGNYNDQNQFSYFH